MHTTNINTPPEGKTGISPNVTKETAVEGSTSRRRRYKTILADVPWPTGQQGKYGAERHYNLMTLERIKAMPVGDLAADNAHLYFWCYPATRYIAEDIMRGWGFEFKDEFVWGKDQMGLGQYFRHAHETLLLGVKGKLPVKFRGQRSFAMLPRQDHSHKPEEVHVMIQRLSPGPYLELFARRPAPTSDWDDVWGDSVSATISIPGYPVPSDIKTKSVDNHVTRDQEADHA
ncbi:MT-A70 family methyltransferase [Microbacterium sp. CFBP 8794]|uniref:MT-A70 family methyltransferase n=1 Tax=Microbacterium sp. CFBP 8794 TaxID=2775269 RepID=UPI0017805D78|nr:MT-A70 family methyltransferase [Microbacterium sp. CFBP 8794]MBD8478936.1 cytosine methyltransferase [Microbacterium sp. CFBP 8794]